MAGRHDSGPERPGELQSLAPGPRSNGYVARLTWSRQALEYFVTAQVNYANIRHLCHRRGGSTFDLHRSARILIPPTGTFIPGFVG